MLKKNCFTLVELLIVVVMIGVLATFATPSFKKMKERGIDDDAKTMIALIQQQAKMIKLKNGNYPLCLAGTAECEYVLGMDIDTESLWTYEVNTVAPDMTITANRASGAYPNRKLWFSTKHSDQEIHCEGSDCFFDGTNFVPLS